MYTDKNIISSNKSKYYDFNPNYKKSLASIPVNKDNCDSLIDYNKYIDEYEPISNVQTIFFDFDNYARLIKSIRKTS
jgi:hypothetical protein